MKDLAWLAGLVEGEGSFVRRGTGGWLFALEMIDRDVVTHARDVWGYGTVRWLAARGLGKKPRWVWRFEARDEVYSLAEALYPLLGKRRRQVIRRLFREIYK
jgi:hypothetical protein